MNKRFTKIICFLSSAVVVSGAAFAAGCGGYFNSSALPGENIFTTDKAVSNGGFAVEKGGYVYFINGVENNTALNDYGAPVKGAIYRISKDNLASRNYAETDRVVPLVAYTGEYNSGLFIYGDYIYYGTPSTAKNANGEILNGNLDMKRTKLDGTETMRDAYVQFSSLTTEYRFVEVDDTVYLMYVTAAETLEEGGASAKNLHSYNTEDGTDTVLAHNVDSVIFDSADKPNPRVYYTMKVKNYVSDSDYEYNQVYTVTADATTRNEYDVSDLLGWDDEEELYINCGTLVFDGIGAADEKTPFNYAPDDETLTNSLRYTYTLKHYEEETLYYTRSSKNNEGAYLFGFGDEALKTDRNPVEGNADSNTRILTDGSSAENYMYIFKDGKLEKVLIAESNGGISANYAGEDGKLQKDISTLEGSKYFPITKSQTATLLFADETYLYYTANSVVNRINHTGSVGDYDGMPEQDNIGEFNAVTVIDAAPVSSWFKPELLQGHLLFASETENMSSYKYVMACDLRGKDGTMMNNAALKEKDELFEGINDVIVAFGNADDYDADTYANLGDALRYASFTGEKEYIKSLADALNAKLEEDEKPAYSEETLAKFAEFFAPTADNEWKDYQDKATVNGSEVYANRREYYYSVLGEMSEADSEAYVKALKSNYLKAYPTDNLTWFEGLSTVAKVFFIIGMCLIGLIVIGGTVVLVLWLVKRNKTRLPEYTKKRVKVDTTDDKSIDVYGSDDNSDGEKTEE